MAHLWVRDAGSWGAHKLVAEHIDLASFAPPALATSSPAHQAANPPASGSVCLVQTTAGASRVWVLIAPPNSYVRVNGRTPCAGLCALADRDEIRIGDGRQYYFSTESLAVVEPFPGSERPTFCGRCRQQIEPGAVAVRCPACKVWYNQSPEFPCWTYAKTCAFCNHPTALDSGFAWAPED